MNFGMRILSAAAKLFGPPRQEQTDVNFRDIGNAGVAAALIALGAKLAKADGVVTSDEIDAFKNVFQSSVDANDGIARFFDLAKQTTLGYEAYAQKVYHYYKSRPDILEDILDGLFHIALADGIVTGAELLFLETTGKIFGFNVLTFNRIRAAHIGRALDDPFLILGIDEDVTDSELKRAYRTMAAANHPDRLMARGLPAELQELATHKMALINRAYSEIVKIRKQYPVYDRLPELTEHQE